VKETSFSRAGNALLWQAAQHFGVKAIFLVRLLILARLLSPMTLACWQLAVS
jgi:hypothetical protein